jgi:hypothetical protein
MSQSLLEAILLFRRDGSTDGLFELRITAAQGSDGTLPTLRRNIQQRVNEPVKSVGIR